LSQEKTSVTVHAFIHGLPKIRSGLSKEINSNKSWASGVRGILKDVILLDNGIEQDVREEIRKQANRFSRNLPLGNEFIKSKRVHSPSFEEDWFKDVRICGVCNHESRAHIDEDLQRYFGIETSKEGRRDKEIIAIAKTYVSNKNPRKANLAILDFTALVCIPRRPEHERCPLKRDCQYLSTHHTRPS
jgi:hypothetical protein